MVSLEAFSQKKPPKVFLAPAKLIVSPKISTSDLDIKSEECKENLKHIHTPITSQYFCSKRNKLLTLLPIRVK